MHTQQRYPTEKRAHECSATKHQTKASEWCEWREIAADITNNQILVQEKFCPWVIIIISNWCIRTAESCERLFKKGKGISSSFWRQQYSLEHEMQRLTYQIPCFSCLVKTVVQQQVAGSTRHWQSSTSSLVFKCFYSFTSERKNKNANICPVAEGWQHLFKQVVRPNSKYSGRLFFGVWNKHLAKSFMHGTCGQSRPPISKKTHLQVGVRQGEDTSWVNVLLHHAFEHSWLLGLWLCLHKWGSLTCAVVSTGQLQASEPSNILR